MSTENDGNKISSYMRNASTKAETIGSKCVYTIIGTSWAISFFEGGFNPTKYVILSLALAIFYVFLDLLYYLISSLFYEYLLIKHFEHDQDGNFQYKSGKKNITKLTQIWMEVGKWWFVAMMIILITSAIFMILAIVSLKTTS